MYCKEKFEYIEKIKKEVCSRILFLDKDIEDLETLNPIITKINECNIADIDEENPIPITLNLSTCGGSLRASKALSNIILQSFTPIYTVGISHTYSAGGLLLIFGHKRFMYKNSIVHFHDLFAGNCGKLTDIEENLKDLKLYRQYMEESIKEKTKIPKKIVADIFDNKREVFFTSKECLEYSIVDSVIDNYFDFYTEFIKI